MPSTITAMEIIVDNSSYPTTEIAENSYKFRPLGLGYANLGALLMSAGCRTTRTRAGATPRRSPRSCAARRTRQCRASRPRPPARSPATPMNESRSSGSCASTATPSSAIDRPRVPYELLAGARRLGRGARARPEYGFRNGQITVLAPTGTIAFLMDCDTTGVEPDIAIVKYKRLVGGGLLKIVNQTVPVALRKLGYDDRGGRRDHRPHRRARHDRGRARTSRHEHLPVFDCAFRRANGARSIHYMGHLRMMAAVQPFLSRRDLQDRQPARPTHGRGHRGRVHPGLEARPQGDRDLPRRLQAHPAAVDTASKRRRRPSRSTHAEAADMTARAARRRAARRRRAMSRSAPVRRWRTASCPAERASFTHKFDIGGHEGYITVGIYEDGPPGEIFVTMAKEGSTIGGLMDSFATSISLALQYGVPLQVLVEKFGHPLRALRLHRQPGDPDRHVDHGLHLPLARLRFLSPDDKVNLGLIDRTAVVADVPASSPGSATDPSGSVAVGGLSADSNPTPSADANGGAGVERPTATDTDGPEGGLRSPLK